MSLPNVQFTNNLGTVYFTTCLIGVTDSWEFDGRVARHVTSISIDGHIQQGAANQALEGILTNRTVAGERYGTEGTLILPWTTLVNVRMVDLQIPPNVYLEWIPVTATFSDDYPDGNKYTMSFFGLTLYNPRISIPVPIMQLRDEYAQMPWLVFGSFVYNDPRVGVFRTRAPERNMNLTLTGTIRVNDLQLPTNLIATLIQRANMGIGNTVPFQWGVPTGYPRPFNLGDAIPEIANDLNLAQVMVTNAQIVWDVEKQVANLTIQMTCPPQSLD